MNNLKRNHPNKKSRQVGRGGKRGKTSGRGTKGQKARSGRKIRPEIRDEIKRIPKLRGHGKNSNMSIADKPFIISFESLEKHFANGAVIKKEELLAKGIIRLRRGRVPRVKVLGNQGAKGKTFRFEGIRTSRPVLVPKEKVITDSKK